jgi:hypothetical protein
VPGKVMLVIQPIGGPDDWSALFHEAGHAEHFANTRPELTVEERRLGDSAVTEGWAMLGPPREAPCGSRGASTSTPGRFVGRRAPPLLRQALPREALYELKFHRHDRRDAATLRRIARGRSRSSRAPSTTRGHRRELLRLLVPAPWASKPSCGAICARSSATPGSRGARPARSCASYGRGPALARRGLPAGHHRVDARLNCRRGSGHLALV